MMKILITVLSAILITAAVIFAAFVAVSAKIFGKGKPYDTERAMKRRPELLERVRAGRKALEKYNPEEVFITSYDGLKLCAHIYSRGEYGGRGVLCMHGYNSGAVNDFAGAVDFFTDNGFTVILADQRAHGKSEGRRITFGTKERFDCRSWCEYIVGRYGSDVKILLDGISMGAATVTCAADREVGLPENVKAVIADCGYSSPHEIIADVAKKNYHIPEFPVLPLLRLAARLDAGFDIDEISSVRSAANTGIPIFFAHGTADDFVPYEMGVKISSSCSSDHVLFSVPGAGHGQSFLVDRDGYERECLGFIGKYLK